MIVSKLATELYPEAFKRIEEWKREFPNEEIKLYDYFAIRTMQDHFETWKEPPYTEGQILDLTNAIKSADGILLRDNLNSAKWVKECFIPVLEKQGIKIIFNN